MVEKLPREGDKAGRQCDLLQRCQENQNRTRKQTYKTKTPGELAHPLAHSCTPTNFCRPFSKPTKTPDVGNTRKFSFLWQYIKKWNR